MVSGCCSCGRLRRWCRLLGDRRGICPAYQVADADEWAIHMPVFERFVDAVVSRYQESNHVVLRSLMEGFIATALVPVERGGGVVPAGTESSAVHSRAM